MVEAFGIRETQTLAVTLRVESGRGQALRPKIESLGRADAPDHSMHHPCTGAARLRPRKFEEGDVGAGAAVLIGVEEVVDAGGVLIDRLLHHAQAERAGVEVDVALGVGCDRGDVVNAFKFHRAVAPIMLM